MANAGKVIGKGVTIELEGNVYRVDDFQHVKPGKGAAFIRTRLSHMHRRSCTGSKSQCKTRAYTVPG